MRHRRKYQPATTSPMYTKSNTPPKHQPKRQLYNHLPKQSPKRHLCTLIWGTLLSTSKHNIQRKFSHQYRQFPRLPPFNNANNTKHNQMSPFFRKCFLLYKLSCHLCTLYNKEPPRQPRRLILLRTNRVHYKERYILCRLPARSNCYRQPISIPSITNMCNNNNNAGANL